MSAADPYLSTQLRGALPEGGPRSIDEKKTSFAGSATGRLPAAALSSTPAAPVGLEVAAASAGGYEAIAA